MHKLIPLTTLIILIAGCSRVPAKARLSISVSGEEVYYTDSVKVDGGLCQFTNLETGLMIYTDRSVVVKQLQYSVPLLEKK